VKTIIEPAKPYMKLLGLQKHRAEETYRLMLAYAEENTNV
jgi:hypothetical protein